jgi:transcriptional regulator GlxA family with amidase domain
MDHRIEKVISVIQSDPMRKRGLRELSRLVNLSPWRLSHLFTAETGISLVHFAQRLRIETFK